MATSKKRKADEENKAYGRGRSARPQLTSEKQQWRKKQMYSSVPEQQYNT